jgi:hypothetical protein
VSALNTDKVGQGRCFTPGEPAAVLVRVENVGTGGVPGQLRHRDQVCR